MLGHMTSAHHLRMTLEVAQKDIYLQGRVLEVETVLISAMSRASMTCSCNVSTGGELLQVDDSLGFGLCAALSQHSRLASNGHLETENIPGTRVFR